MVDGKNLPYMRATGYQKCKVDMVSKKIFFVHEVHYLNFLSLSFLSLFGNIAYIKRARRLNLSSKRFTRVDINDLLLNGQSEFNAINALAFEEFKSEVESQPSKYTVTAKVARLRIDFTAQNVIDVGRRFEILRQYHYIASIIQKLWPNKKIVHIYPIQGLNLGKSFIEDKSFGSRALTALNSVTDFLRDKIISAFEVSRFLLPNYNAKLFTKMKRENFSVLWSGINPQEINFDEGAKLASFRFLEQRQLNNAGRIIYVLPVRPFQAKMINIKLEGQCFVISANEMPRLLPRKFRFALLGSHLMQRLLHVVHKYQGAEQTNLAPFEYIVRGVCEYQLCKTLSLETFITSNSAHTTCNSKFAICSALGIKTVLWQYAGVGLIPYDATVINTNGRPVGRFAQYCFACSDVLVWNENDIKILKERLIKSVGTFPNITAIGPMMSGDLSNIPSSETEKQNNRIHFLDQRGIGRSSGRYWVTIFDMPTPSSEVIATGELPIKRTTEDEQDLFFGGLIRLFEENDELVYVFKPKRRTKADRFILSKNHRLFLRLAQGSKTKHRFFLVPHNIDPYVPISLSDAVISMPFSSALQAAISFGLPAVYFDAKGQYNHVYPENKYVTVKNYSELNLKMTEWIKSKNTPFDFHKADFQKVFAKEIGVRSSWK